MTESVEVSREPQAGLAFRVPYCEATWQDFGKTSPDSRDGMRIVLSEIDRQCVDNFTLFKSQRFPGVELSVVKLSPSRELVEAIAGTQISAEVSQEPKALTNSKLNEQWFLFSAFAKPPDGNAFGSLDMGIDRYIQLLQKVARRVKAGEPLGEFNIYLIGSGTGFGERITQEYIEAIRKDGLNARGRLNAEIVESFLPRNSEGEIDTENNRIVFQGVSMGTTSIDNMMPNLPEEVRVNSQALLDSPAGTHRPFNILKQGQVVAGMIAEFAYREAFDNTAKVLGAGKKPFIDFMQSQGKIEPDTPEQTKLKNTLTATTSRKLVRGQPLNTEDNRYFIRERSHDVLTAGPARAARRLVKIGKAQVLKDSGRSLKAVVEGPHFFQFRHHRRWAQILEYIKNVNSPTV